MVKIRKRHIYSLVQWLVLAMAAFFVFLFVQNWILYSGVIQCHSECECVFDYIFMHLVSIDWLLTVFDSVCVFSSCKRMLPVGLTCKTRWSE
jgi:cellulose synthase/poly-beta-1,6-N-acetylglucosamine synthase-like glycosyltransferase